MAGEKLFAPPFPGNSLLSGTLSSDIQDAADVVVVDRNRPPLSVLLLLKGFRQGARRRRVALPRANNNAGDPDHAGTHDRRRDQQTKSTLHLFSPLSIAH